MKYFIYAFFVLCISSVTAQVKDSTHNMHYQLELRTVVTSNDHVPFWFRSNQYGDRPLDGLSAGLLANVGRNYSEGTKKKLLDWGFGLEGRVNAGDKSNFILTEGYLKGRLWVFQLKVGRSKDIMGLGDTSLSSGFFAVSGNALGIPKAELSIPEFYTIPLFQGLFSVKGNFVYGQLGQVPVQYGQGPDSVETYFHQKSFYARLGKPAWRLHLFAGFNHQVLWGGEKEIWGKYYKLSDWKTFDYVVFGKTWNYSKIGNHIGSIDLALQYDFNKFSIYIYRQNFYDEGALYYLANIADGLNGISVTNKSVSNKTFSWHKILFELLYTKDQAGYASSKPTKSGDENYYNNYVQKQGWSYKEVGLGTPFISTYKDTRSGFPNDPFDYFNNNRVMALHLGIEGAIKQLEFTSKLSYSKNYGTFGTNPRGHTTGNIIHTPTHGFFKEVDQFSAYLAVEKALGNKYRIGLSGAVDAGKLLYNSNGFMLKIIRSFQ